MCFTPWVSLTTALIEFAVATFILVRYKNYLVPAFSAIFIYVLGFYQFTEFMLCTGDSVMFWAAIGFITYTFLPAIGLHMAIRFTGGNFNNYLLYLPPIAFAFAVFFRSDFILSAGCERIFVSITTILGDPSNWIFHDLYMIYYFGFTMVFCFLFFLDSKNHQMKRIYFWWAGLTCSTIIAPVVLMIVLPSLEVVFPSVYCEFALLFTIAALVSSEIYSRNKKREKLIK